MENQLFNHQFICKLLSVCANHAILEGASKTQDIILMVSDLVRYIYDDRRDIVTLDDEIDTVKKFLLLQKFIGLRNIEFSLGVEKSYNYIYVKHLSILKRVVEDIELTFENTEETLSLRYVLEYLNSRVVINKFLNREKVESIVVNNIN